MTMEHKMEPLGVSLAKGATVVGTATAGATAYTIEVNRMLGYTLEQWQMFAVIVAAVSGIGGILLTAIFKYLHYRLELRKVENLEDDKP